MDSKRQRCDKALRAIMDLESSTCFATDLLFSKAHILGDHNIKVTSLRIRLESLFSRRNGCRKLG